MGACLSHDQRQATQYDRPHTLPAPPKPDISSGGAPFPLPRGGARHPLSRSQSAPPPSFAGSGRGFSLAAAAASKRPPSILGRATYPDKVMGKYTIEKLLGQGKDGVTFRVVEGASGGVYACKSIAKAPLLRAGAGEAVRTELRIMYHLQGHPSVVSLHEALEDECCVYFVMEECTGGDLVEHLVRAGTYNERDAARCVRDVLTAVAYMHDMGVLHRDIKLENFLYAQDPTTGELSLRVIDFGMSTFFRPGQVFGEVLGTCYYMAPELLVDKPAYTESADIWAVGVILYMLLSGRPPFEGVRDDDVWERVATSPGPDLWEGPWGSISSAAKECVCLMMARDPSARPSARALLLHPWIAEGGAANDGRPLEPAVLGRMRRFAEANRLCKAALKVLGATRSRTGSDELVGLQQLFNALDTEQRGAIQVTSLQHTLSTQLSSASSLASSFAAHSPPTSTGVLADSSSRQQGAPRQRHGHHHHHHGHGRHNSMPDQRQLQQQQEWEAQAASGLALPAGSSSNNSREGSGQGTAAAVAADAAEPATPASTMRQGPFRRSSQASTGVGSDANSRAMAGAGEQVEAPQQQLLTPPAQRQSTAEQQQQQQHAGVYQPQHRSPDQGSPTTSFSAWCDSPGVCLDPQHVTHALLPHEQTPTTAAAGGSGSQGLQQQQQEQVGLADLRHMQPMKQQGLRELDDMLGWEGIWQPGTTATAAGGGTGALVGRAAAPRARSGQPDDTWCSCSSDGNSRSSSSSDTSYHSHSSRTRLGRQEEEEDVEGQAALLAALEGADLNGDGVIDWEEFLATTMSPDMLLTEEDLARVFQLFDTDQDGYLSADEIRNALYTTLPTPHPNTRSSNASGGVGSALDVAATSDQAGPGGLGGDAAAAAGLPALRSSSSGKWTPFRALAQQGWLSSATSSGGGSSSWSSQVNSLRGSSLQSASSQSRPQPGAMATGGVALPLRSHHSTSTPSSSSPPQANSGSAPLPVSDTGCDQGRGSADPMSDIEAALSADVAALMSAVDRDQLGRISFTSFKKLVASGSITQAADAKQELLAPAAS